MEELYLNGWTFILEVTGKREPIPIIKGNEFIIIEDDCEALVFRATFKDDLSTIEMIPGSAETIIEEKKRKIHFIFHEDKILEYEVERRSYDV